MHISHMSMCRSKGALKWSRFLSSCALVTFWGWTSFQLGSFLLGHLLDQNCVVGVALVSRKQKKTTNRSIYCGFRPKADQKTVVSSAPRSQIVWNQQAQMGTTKLGTRIGEMLGGKPFFILQSHISSSPNTSGVVSHLPSTRTVHIPKPPIRVSREQCRIPVP